MQELLFKGKSDVYVGSIWIEGNSITQYESGEIAIFPKNISKFGYDNQEIYKRVQIKPNTLCKYIGKNDMFGRKLFTNDVVKITINGVPIEVESKIEYKNGLYVIKCFDGSDIQIHRLDDYVNIEYLYNIFDD